MLTEHLMSHQEVQFWWTEYHLAKGNYITLVTTCSSGSSNLNRVEYKMVVWHRLILIYSFRLPLKDHVWMMKQEQLINIVWRRICNWQLMYTSVDVMAVVVVTLSFIFSGVLTLLNYKNFILYWMFSLRDPNRRKTNCSSRGIRFLYYCMDTKECTYSQTCTFFLPVATQLCAPTLPTEADGPQHGCPIYMVPTCIIHSSDVARPWGRPDCVECNGLSCTLSEIWSHSSQPHLHFICSTFLPNSRDANPVKISFHHLHNLYFLKWSCGLPRCTRIDKAEGKTRSGQVPGTTR